MIETVAATPSLIDQAHQQLLQAIADGTLPAGTRIRQADLATQLGVSRQPVSHALHLLKRQGLVEETGRKGLRVVPLDPHRAQHLYEVREVLDGLAARLAARRVAAGLADAASLARLNAMIASSGGYCAQTAIPVLVRADTEFHRELTHLSGNPAIEEMTAPLWPHLMRSIAHVLTELGYRETSWQDHAIILAHVAAGDADAAERTARRHTGDGAIRIAEHLRAAAKAA
jgi:DNA-binding GntR family transcriptional regulator